MVAVVIASPTQAPRSGSWIVVCVKQGYGRDQADFVFILWASGVCVGGGLDDLLLAAGGGDGGEKSDCWACVCVCVMRGNERISV